MPKTVSRRPLEAATQDACNKPPPAFPSKPEPTTPRPVVEPDTACTASAPEKADRGGNGGHRVAARVAPARFLPPSCTQYLPHTPPDASLDAAPLGLTVPRRWVRGRPWRAESLVGPRSPYLWSPDASGLTGGNPDKAPCHSAECQRWETDPPLSSHLNLLGVARHRMDLLLRSSGVCIAGTEPLPRPD